MRSTIGREVGVATGADVVIDAILLAAVGQTIVFSSG